MDKIIEFFTSIFKYIQDAIAWIKRIINLFKMLEQMGNLPAREDFS